MRLLSWILGLSLLWTGSIQAQEVVARLDIGKRDPKPDFIEYSPVDKGLITMGPTSRTSSRYYSVAKYSVAGKLYLAKMGAAICKLFK